MILQLIQLLDECLYFAQYVYYKAEWWIQEWTQCTFDVLVKRLTRKPAKIKQTLPPTWKLAIVGLVAIIMASVIFIWQLRKRRLMKQIPDEVGHGEGANEEHNLAPYSEQDLKNMQADSLFSKEILLVCRQLKPTTFSEALNGSTPRPDNLYETSMSVIITMHSTKGRWIAKIIPIEISTAMMLSEAIITKTLSELRDNPVYRTEGFVKYLGSKCIRDKYPRQLLELHGDTKHYYRFFGSFNPRPLLGYFLTSDTFMLLRLGMSGTRLSEVAVESVQQVYSLILQVIWSIAIAEHVYQFEHRDLQIDNILVRQTDESLINFVYHSKVISVKSFGTQCTICDFGFSRLTLNGKPVYFDPQKLFSTVFIEERSCMGFDYMRGALRNDWSQYCPKNNVIGMWSLLLEIDNYMTALNFHNNARKQLFIMRRELSKCESICEFVEKARILTTLQDI